MSLQSVKSFTKECPAVGDEAELVLLNVLPQLYFLVILSFLKVIESPKALKGLQDGQGIVERRKEARALLHALVAS